MDILDKEIVKSKTKKDQIDIDQMSDDDPILDGKDIGKPNKFFKKGILTAINFRDFDYFEHLGGDEIDKAKTFKSESYVVLRWLSSVGNPDWEQWKKYGKKGKPPIKDNEYTRLYLQLTNEVVNKHFWDLNQHPRLQYYLMCACGSKEKLNHNWVDAPSKSTNSKLDKLLMEWYPDINTMELEILKSSLDSKEKIEEYCKNIGLSDKDISDILKDEGYRSG